MTLVLAGLGRAQVAYDSFTWQESAAGQPTPVGAVVSISEEAYGTAVDTPRVEAICSNRSNGVLVVGGVDASGICEVPYEGLAYALSVYDVLTGPPAAWETPAVQASAEALPEARMVLVGTDGSGVGVYPCRALGGCTRWSSPDHCELRGWPVGRVSIDSAQNSACIIAERDSGTCICAEFDVLVVP